jgi:hypothetical protein
MDLSGPGALPFEIVNEVLSLNDVRAVEGQLEEVDTAMISGEGRHLQRKALDIQYSVSGSYRLFRADPLDRPRQRKS